MSKHDYNSDLTGNIIKKVKSEIDKRVSGGNVDGDTDLWVLLLISDIHSRVHGIEKNPALILGTWFRDYPSLSWIVFGITSLISIGSILAIIVTFMNKVGLAVIVQP